MTINDVLDPVLKLRLVEKRGVEEDFAEIVFHSKDTKLWVEELKKTLGEPAKPAGERPGEEHLKLTEKYGGIWANQTLFFKNCGTFVFLGMFWPWSNGQQTTFKLVKTSP
ncbi:MAG: hypothetical protein HQL26_05840 [Candidatus Omnitrophica bacterium]|nr:hypothetical protein [Candidatus Omnitrophota bacterium]